MHASFYNPRGKSNQSKLTTSPIFGKQGQKTHVKSTDYKFDTESRDSIHTSTDCPSQLMLAPSSSASSFGQSENQTYLRKTYSDKGFSYDNSYSVLTTNSCLNMTNSWSLTERTESLIEKMERFESKLAESRKIIENLKKERSDLLTKAEKIDEILSAEISPKTRRLDLRVQSTASSPGANLSKENLISTGTPRSAQLPTQRTNKKKLSTFSQACILSSFKGGAPNLKKSESAFRRHSPKKVSFA